MIIVLMYICICNAISERQVQEAVAQGASELSDLQASLGVATCCGHCAEVASEYLPGGRYAGAQATKAVGITMTEVVMCRPVRQAVAA